MFVIAAEKFFSFRADWHELDRARPLVRQYQIALDSVLRSHSELERCVAHCVHCGIRFLTHPRNVGREDLRCPFGCRRQHRRWRSNQRSVAYYRTASGKAKKKRLNACRRGNASPEQQRTDSIEQATTPNEQLPGELSVKVELRWDGVVLDESSLLNSRMLPYVRMVVRLIERIEHGGQELVGLLRQAMRQHSIAYRRRSDYVVRFLQQYPP